MSIINDALKKVQTNLNVNSKPSSPAQTTPEPSPAPSFSTLQPAPIPVVPKMAPKVSELKPEAAPAQTPAQKRLIALSILVLLAVAATVVFLLKQLESHLVPLASTKKSGLVVLPSISVAAPKAPAKAFNVNGIMTSGDKKTVLINDTVYEEGDIVDDITIVKIYNNNIVVRENGQEKVLRVR